VAGGEKIDVGIDTNGDGILESSEIQKTAYVCNGIPQSTDGGAGTDTGTSCSTAASCPTVTNPCAAPTCIAGTCGTTFVAAGTSCGAGVCNGAGSCVGCLAASDCPGTDTDCQTRGCFAGGFCGVSNTAAGTPTSAQTPGDCRQNQCDGAGNTTSVPDNTDLPLNSNACTIAVCTNGVPSHPAEPAGTSCGPALICNGSGACVSCVAASDCPGTDSDCQTRICVAGACGLENALAGLPTSVQTPGDCRQNQCDGAGNIVSTVDNTDTPASGNQCASGACISGVPSTVPAPAGSTCSQSGGVQCNGQGSCI
jgi:hypothetical protein